ncbi:hypothetical protein GCM10010441_15300 [Kitasatospora paracochleata]|uniref:Concanavalin A-like lectin/glucanase superfamily protein n=1 Tax=Kitasatospora paracochleata TaxID=58354 RepID=A0ABT1IS73_9ACTN|nr:hypothetical protein [Kitasatospora paracochleata]MCP2307985.1 hypothetical protein [Kitasatospora paracochleata]
MVLSTALGRRIASGTAALALAVLPAVLGLQPAAAAASGPPTPADLNTSGSFADSFTQGTELDTDPMYGLNVGLDRREQDGTARQISYTRVSGRWDTAVPPAPWYVQTSHPQHPNKLLFSLGHSAVMLDAPALADESGHYTVSTTVDPVEGDTTGADWASIMLSRSHRSTGYVTNADVDLGLTVSSGGKLALFHGGGGEVPFWTGRVTPGAGPFAVSLTVSTGADRLVSLTVDGTRFDVTAPAGVTRWPSSSYLYLGAYLDSAGEVTTFGDGTGHGLAVSRVDTTAASGPKPFVDTFDGVPGDTADFGLDQQLSARQPSPASAHYTQVSGAPGLPVTPAAGGVRVNSPDRPNALSFTAPTAVRLDKPATADLSGTYTVHAVLTPVVGSRTSRDWASLAVSGSEAGTGWVEGPDVALGLRIRADGTLQLFQHGTATWASEQSVPAADSYRVSLAVAAGAARQATLVVNGTAFTVPATADLPRDGYVYLGSHPSTTGQAGTVDDLRISMIGGLSYYGYFDIMDPDAPNNSADHSAEVASWTNLNGYLAQDPRKGYLDYCGPASCIVDAGYQVYDQAHGGPNPDAPAALAGLRAAIGSNIDKVAAVYVIDEPYYHGLDARQVQTAVDQIRAVFPDKMIHLTMDAGSLFNPADTIPSGVDVVGFDDYCKGRATVRDELSQLERKLASPDQHLMLFPESITAGLWGCEHTTDAAMAAANAEYRAIAGTDPRVVYLQDFRWLGPDQAATYPLTVAEQQREGRAVVNATPHPPLSSVGVHRPGDRSFHEADRAAATIGSAQFGAAGDVPLVGHWTGPGTDTIGVYRPSSQTFLLSADNATATVTARFGNPGDVPLVGDWSGQGRDTIGVYRPGDQTFYLSNDNATVAYAIKMGNPGDTPLVGNWSGQGRDTIGVYRPSTQMFYLSNSNTSANPDHVVKFGNPGDVPLKGDWDGTGIDTVGVYRPGDRTFFGAARDSNVVVHSATFGDLDDLPLIGNWG